MGIPQIIMIVIYALGLGIALVQNGTKKEGTNSFWVTFFGTLINVAILWWGGFWK